MPRFDFGFDDQGDIFVDGHKVDPFDWHGMAHLISFNEDGTVVRVKEDDNDRFSE